MDLSPIASIPTPHMDKCTCGDPGLPCTYAELEYRRFPKTSAHVGVLNATSSDSTYGHGRDHY